MQDLYLRARYHLDKGSEEEINRAIEYFRQAIERNPQDARNYAGLAVSYLALSDYYLSPADTLALAKQAATKALQLDENMAETHVSIGAIHFLYDWDWQQADREFAWAVELNPNSYLFRLPAPCWSIGVAVESANLGRAGVRFT